MPEDLESRLEGNYHGRNKADQKPPKDHAPKEDPNGLDSPLPCDVTLNGGMTFRKGVKLRTLVNAAERWRKDAMEALTRRPPEVSRDDIIQALLATRGQSEGVTADAILSLLSPGPSKEEIRDRLNQESNFPQAFKDRMSQMLTPGKQ